jgi:molecular chaperone GrpE
VEEKNEVISEELEQETDEAIENADTNESAEEASVEESVKDVESEADEADEAENEAAGEEKESAKEGKEKKSFFKKKKDKKDEQIEELQDRLMRNLAEFENFRNRSEKEKAQMFEIGAKDIIEKILPVLDNFERGLGTVSEEEKDSAFVQGIEQIYKQFVKALEDAGVKPIEAVGQEFNPDFHNAVMHGEDEELGENIVSEEFQKGYMYRDTVVRHSMVKVVN